MQDDKPSQFLRDVWLVEQLEYRYAAAIDTIDMELIDTCMAVDCEIDYRTRSKSFTRDDFKEYSRTALASLDGTHHMMSSVSVDIDGDCALAHTYYQST